MNMNSKFKQWFEEQGFSVQRNGTLRNRGNRRVTVESIFADWMALRRFRSDDTWEPVNIEDIEDFVESERGRVWPQAQANTDDRAMQRALAAQQSLSDFVDAFNDGYECKYTGSSYILVKKGQLYCEQIAVKTASNEIRLHMKMNLQTPPASEDCVAAIEQIIAEAKREKRDYALALVKYDPEVKNNGFSFKEWTEKLFDHYKIKNTKLNRKMWRYMMHSIKRAAFGLKGPDFKIMYLVFSRIQGIGKSRLLKNLAQPFVGAFNNSATLDMLMDDNSIKALCSEGTALIDFQELGLGKGGNGSKDVDISAMMKRAVTLDEHKSRELYTSANTTVLCNAVMASSTNLHISEVVHDTDYRRYFTFESEMTKADAIVKDWEEIDAFFNDTLTTAYRFLNEEEIPSIDKATMSELRAEQSTYARRVDLVTQWLNDCGLTIIDKSDAEKEGVNAMDINLLYKKFKNFLSQCGLPNYSRQRMQQLIAASCDILADSVDGRNVYYVKEAK